jgi:hypothetical protein
LANIVFLVDARKDLGPASVALARVFPFGKTRERVANIASSKRRVARETAMIVEKDAIVAATSSSFH